MYSELVALSLVYAYDVGFLVVSFFSIHSELKTFSTRLPHLLGGTAAAATAAAPAANLRHLLLKEVLPLASECLLKLIIRALLHDGELLPLLGVVPDSIRRLAREVLVPVLRVLWNRARPRELESRRLDVLSTDRTVEPHFDAT